MRQFSLFLGFKAKMLHKDLVLNNGAAGIKEGKNISIDMEIKGPLDKSEKPETKVISMKPANTFNIEIEEFFPEGSVTFRVILDNNDPQEVFYNIKYYYELGKELKKAAFFGNLSKDKPYVKSPNLN